MPAIAHEVRLAARLPVGGVERKAVDHVVRHGQRKPRFGRDHAKRIKRGVARGFAGQRHRGPLANR